MENNTHVMIAQLMGDHSHKMHYWKLMFTPKDLSEFTVKAILLQLNHSLFNNKKLKKETILLKDICLCSYADYPKLDYKEKQYNEDNLPMTKIKSFLSANLQETQTKCYMSEWLKSNE